MIDIKICGTRTLAGAQRAVESGATYIGFIFAPARRAVRPADAAAMLRSLPGRSHVGAVGVFVDEPPEHLLEVVRLCQLDAVQLHGHETPDYAARIRTEVPVIKVFHLTGPDDLARMALYDVDGYFVEPLVPGHSGGAGVRLDWRMLAERQLDRQPFILSGGLNATNVGDAIATVQPQGVDVSSGVETDGQHDLDKISAFIQAVRRTMTEGGTGGNDAG